MCSAWQRGKKDNLIRGQHDLPDKCWYISEWFLKSALNTFKKKIKIKVRLKFGIKIIGQSNLILEICSEEDHLKKGSAI